MLRALTAFGQNDMRSIRRDSLLLYVSLVPWIMVVLLRLLAEPLTVWLADSFSIDAVAYYPLVLGIAFIVEIPMLFGLVFGLLMLDERDDQTLTALQVTPVSLRGYLSYRLVTSFVFSVVYVLLLTPLTGLLPLAMLPMLVPVALVTSLLAPAVLLLLVTFAGSKLEGLALLKGIGILLVGPPLVGYFIGPTWHLLPGILPTYWPAAAYWAADTGGAAWPYLLAGTAYYALLLLWLGGRFQARLARQ
jgi:fluoroquinolone transport system permease protein